MFVSNTVWLDVVDGKLKGTSARVLGFLASQMDMKNRFMGTQAGVCAAMGLTAPAVSKAFRELAELDYVFRVKERGGLRVWLIDARKLYRGAGARHKATVERQAKLREAALAEEDARHEAACRLIEDSEDLEEVERIVAMGEAYEVDCSVYGPVVPVPLSKDECPW